MIVSIHQPNFFPYYPIFQKMEQSDIFIILGNCQFEKNNYQNRFDIDERWHTMRVNGGMQLIKDKKYVSPFEDWEKIKNKLPKYRGILEQFDFCISDNLLNTNSNIIRYARKLLKLKTIVIHDNETELKSTERLVYLCKKSNATKYLSGISGKIYLDVKQFEQQGIEVIFQDKMIKKSLLEVLYERT